MLWLGNRRIIIVIILGGRILWVGIGFGMKAGKVFYLELRRV